MTKLVQTKTNAFDAMPGAEVVMQWDMRWEPSVRLLKAFKAERFVIESDREAFEVIDLRVGLDSQMPDATPRPGELFAPKATLFQPHGGAFDPCSPHMRLTAKLRNKTEHTVELRCHWLGTITGTHEGQA